MNKDINKHTVVVDILTIDEILHKNHYDIGWNEAKKLFLKQFIPLRKMAFGKYKGEFIPTILKNNIEYIHWALNNIKSFRLTVQETCFYEKCFKLYKEKCKVYSNPIKTWDVNDREHEFWMDNMCNFF